MKQAIRVLVADDNDDVRQLFGDILELAEDVELELVQDGQQAVERALAGRFDMAFLDVRMPNLTGVNAAVRILHSRPETRIHLMTGCECDVDLEPAVEAGVRSVVAKPFGVDEVLALVEETRRRIMVA